MTMIRIIDKHLLELTYGWMTLQTLTIMDRLGTIKGDVRITSYTCNIILTPIGYLYSL